ncbi:MAG: MFS transporter [Acidobacteria bacterium]|nr:MAG: MFS transporter [Acidobacteriota bacterium]
MTPPPRNTDTKPDLLPIAALSVLVMVAFGTLFYAYSIFITGEAAGAEYSISLLSLAWTGAVLVGGGFAFMVGRRADRHGVRGIMGLGSVVGAAGLILLAASQTGWQLVLVSWLLIGPAGAMTFYEPAFIAVDQWFGLAGSTRALVTLTLIGGLAGPIFIPLAGIMTVALGWRWAAVVLAAVLLVTGLVVTVFFFPKSSGNDHGHDARASTGLVALFGDRRFVVFTAASLLAFAAVQAVILHRIAVFEQAGFAITVVAWWAAVAGLMSLPGRWVAPYLSHRIRPVLVSAAVTLLMAGAVAMAAVAAMQWQMAMHFIVFGLAFGAATPMRAVVMSRWYSGPQYGRIMGTQWTIVATLAAAGPLIVGLLRDGTGSYAIPITLTAGVLVVAAVLTAVAEPASSQKLRK